MPACVSCAPKPRARDFNSFNGGALPPVHIDNDYTEALPSLNFTFNLADDKLLRFGAGPRHLTSAAR